MASVGLVACGILDDTESRSVEEDESGLLSTPEDTTSRAVTCVEHAR